MRVIGCFLWILWLAIATVDSQADDELSRGRDEGRGGGGGRAGGGRGRGRGGRERSKDTRPLIRPRQEVVNPVSSYEGPQNATNFLTFPSDRDSELNPSVGSYVDNIPPMHAGGIGSGRNIVKIGGPGSVTGATRGDSDVSRLQMDTIILLLQRLSDRLAALESIQNQRGERMDTVHYRLTRLELQAEETKGTVNELSISMRHRMESTDNEMERVVDSIDDLKTSIGVLGQQTLDLKTAVETLGQEEREGEDTGGAKKLQAAMTSLYGLRSMTQTLQQDVAVVSQNMSMLSNITEQIGHLRDGMVTKQYLHQNLNEIRVQQMSPSYQMFQPQARQGRNKGKASKEPEDCWKILQKGQKRSGVYRIQPQYSTVPFFVYCDMETDGGGWTVIQRREDGSVDFLREWADYKHGFGNLAGEFWLGNEKIHLLTNQHVSKLRVDLADFDQQEGHAAYSAFALGSELEGYSLKLLGQYTGDAGDSLRYHVGRRFSTIDVDNDAWPEESCARKHAGAWWYKACEASNLNARYLHGPVPADHEYSCLYWYDFRGPNYSLWRSRMMIRRGGMVGEPIFKDFKKVKSETTTSRPNVTELPTTTQIPDPRGHPDESFYNPEHDPYAAYDYPYDPYG